MENMKRLIWWLCKGTVSGILLIWILFWYMSGTPLGLPRFLFTYYVVGHYYMEPLAKTALFEGALRGLVDSVGEPHSEYLDSETLEEMMNQTAGEYSGVGIVLGERGQGLEVISAVEGQPASKAGIMTGDRIEAIDGVSTGTIAIDEASRRIRGKEGTEVVLKISRNNESTEYRIVREKITLPTVKGKLLEDGIGYIRIGQFSERTGDDFSAEYEKLLNAGMTKLVLDLRNNPGGLVTSARDVSDYIVPEGPVVSINTRYGPEEVYESEGIGKSLPLVVLINEGSASASEIIAGAVQDRRAGTVMGTKSYGKGTVQTVINNFGDEAIKITIAKYHTPNDRVIDGIGIIPDIESELLPGERQSSGIDAAGEPDTQVKAAVGLLRTK